MHASSLIGAPIGPTFWGNGTELSTRVEPRINDPVMAPCFYETYAFYILLFTCIDIKGIIRDFIRKKKLFDFLFCIFSSL